jgi:hypothetical protein
VRITSSDGRINQVAESDANGTAYFIGIPEALYTIRAQVRLWAV